jgi:hypothetical protein
MSQQSQKTQEEGGVNSSFSKVHAHLRDCEPIIVSILLELTDKSPLENVSEFTLDGSRIVLYKPFETTYVFLEVFRIHCVIQNDLKDP